MDEIYLYSSLSNTTFQINKEIHLQSKNKTLQFLGMKRRALATTCSSNQSSLSLRYFHENIAFMGKTFIGFCGLLLEIFIACYQTCNFDSMYLPEERCCQPTWNLVKYHPTKSGIEQVSEKNKTKKLTRAQLTDSVTILTLNRTI